MNYQNYNDYELIYMVREHDDDSYDVLFQKYLPIIKKIASDYYKNFSSYGCDLDDFIQEGYLGFQRAVSSYDEEKDILFYTFVVICIHRKILSFCRKITSSRKNISNHYLVDCDDVPLLDPFPGMESLFLNRDFLTCLWNVIYSFPFEYTCVFELRMNQFHYSEISELLDIPIRRAHFIVNKVQKKIRQELNYVN